MAATVLAAVLSVAAPMTIVSGLAALVAAALLVARALPWKPLGDAEGARCSGCCMSAMPGSRCALVLRAGVDLGLDLPASAPDHAFTIGGIGVLTLGMMARTARGHTGRPIEATRLMTAAFAIINLAAVVRVFGPMAAPELHPVIGVVGRAVGARVPALPDRVCADPDRRPDRRPAGVRRRSRHQETT